MIYLDPVEKAREYLYIRESSSQNRGLRVEAIQHWSNGNFGDSWCMEFATMVLDICYQGVAPIPRQGSCEEVRQLSLDRGWTVVVPYVGDLVLSINSAGIAHHVGIVTKVNPLTAIAGNTSEDGKSSNGDRVAEHEISIENKVFVHYPR